MKDEKLYKFISAHSGIVLTILFSCMAMNSIFFILIFVILNGLQYFRLFERLSIIGIFWSLFSSIFFIICAVWVGYKVAKIKEELK